MIIEWSVENFLSFSEQQKLSCEATPDSSLRDSNVFVLSSKKEEIVKSIAIFGANGSGKSNFLDALWHLQHIAIKGIRDGGTEQYYYAGRHGECFPGSLCHTKNSNKYLSSNIEFVVLVDEVKYHYGFSITYWGTIEKEFLTVYLTHKPQKWFSRQVIYNPENEFSGYQYETCVKLKGEKYVWEKATDSTELFLAKASKLGSKQLLPFYEWLCNRLVFLDERNLPQIAGKLRDSHSSHKGISELCRFLDLPYTGGSDKNLMFTTKNLLGNGWKPLFYENQSENSYDLWQFAFVLLDVFQHGKTLVVDGCLDKFHPLTIRKVLELFHNPAINSKKSQLLFTTHMVSLLDQKLLRRDQIWFVEKKFDESDKIDDGFSELHRLTEFSPRKSDNIERNYLAGEYGALPKPGDISALINAIRAA